MAAVDFTTKAFETGKAKGKTISFNYLVPVLKTYLKFEKFSVLYRCLIVKKTMDNDL